jgi:hypothetical protein
MGALNIYATQPRAFGPREPGGRRLDVDAQRGEQ